MEVCKCETLRQYVKYLDAHPAEARAMGERGRAFVQAHHTYPVLAARFLEALQ